VALAELREADAPPSVQVIYDALRRASGVAQINLIWRHLAMLPGVLPWAWAAVRPPLEGGAVAAAGARLAASVPLPAMATPIDDAAWRAAGLAPADRATVLAVVETYNRGNITNLVVLTALRRSMAGQEAGAPAPALAPATAPADLAPLPAIPPLPRAADLAPAAAALVATLAARHTGATAAGIVPSLYLHLAHWPALLAALPRWIAPVIDRLEEGRQAAIEAAEAEAAALRPPVSAPTPVPSGHAEAVQDALERFTTQVIPEMVPVGLHLRRRLRPA
jgi:hypothetical protein